jgi:predicted transposase YdaD
MSAKEKIVALAACGIKVTREIETEVDSMTTYTASILRKGREQGRTEGREQGRTEGREQGYAEANAKIIERMLRKGKTPEEIHDLLDYSMEEIEQVEKRKIETR